MALKQEELKLYETWLQKADDEDIAAGLQAMEGDEKEISECFYRYLEFGTGGLRGIIGAGTNRMNIYTVSMASQALADYLAQKEGPHSVAIGYDSRNKSTDFAKCAAATLASNGVKVYIFPELQPTPVLSFAVRELGCSAGIVITASHNPAKYNGFKCYGSEGYQMTDSDAGEVYSFMQKLDIFDDVKRGDFDELMKQGMINWIEDSLVESFLDAVEACSVNPGLCKGAGLKVIYTPLCGAGNKPVCAILKRIGIDDVTVVPQQEKPDGNFTTCPKPNPEFRAAFELALKLAETVKPDLLLATDPDSDRVGIAVKSGDEYVLMSGNEVGALMLNYMLSCRKAQGNLPKNPVCVSTIVSSDIGTAIADKFGCEMRRVLTGFKYIGEIICELEAAGEKDRFIMGYEESYGYLCGTHARDKDAVVASMMICEMAAYYKKNENKSLLDVMNDIYGEFGYYGNRLLNYEFEGQAGVEFMNSVMDKQRKAPSAEIAGDKVVTMYDYLESVRKNMADGSESEITLPKSNVISYKLENGGSFIIRPSGTEPKIKVYTAAVKDGGFPDEKLDAFEKAANDIMGKEATK